MSFYNLGESEVTRIIESLGYPLPEGYMKSNFEYYIDRTSHGSTLSRLVHARLAWQMGNRELDGVSTWMHCDQTWWIFRAGPQVRGSIVV